MGKMSKKRATSVGMMSAMSIPVSCVGVKTHVFMNDLVETAQRKSQGASLD